MTKPGVPRVDEADQLFDPGDLSLVRTTNIEDCSSTLLNSSHRRESGSFTTMLVSWTRVMA